MHTMSAFLPGLAMAHDATGFSPFRPALQPIPTMSTREQSSRKPSSFIRMAVSPGVSQPVEVMQQR